MSWQDSQAFSEQQLVLSRARIGALGLMDGVCTYMIPDDCDCLSKELSIPAEVNFAHLTAA